MHLDARGALPSVAQWREAEAALQRAIELDPREPAHYELLARWYERYTLRLPAQSPLTAPYLEQSLAHFRRAATLRPSSPYTWTNLALVKQRLNAFDDEFQRAVLNAARLGPWEPEVQLALAYLAFTSQARLSAPARAAAQGAIANGLRRYDRELFHMARRYGALLVLCAVPQVGASPLAVACI